jgi:catechol 2,3-dioxygenase-like lactoylglutathione lyase family enzyme
VAIRSVFLNVADIGASVDFYVRHLGAVAREVNADAAVLDVVTAQLRLARVPNPDATTFVADDLQAGFRHVGFKVADIKAHVAALQAEGVEFHLEPIHAEGDVWITFFYDPDGTMIELVEGPLQYHEVYSEEDVQRDWALGTPSRPRFDHIGETVADLDATTDYFGQLGYRLMAGIHQPSDSRGFEIAYLREGDTSLEVFTFAHAEKSRRDPQLTAPGFAAVEFDGDAPSNAAHVGNAFGVEVFADPDGLLHAVHRS